MKTQKVIINKKMKKPVKKRVMKKVVKRFLKYIRNPKYEFGFQITSLHKRWSNLPAYVCVDNTGTWINLGDKKIILFQSNNSDDVDFAKLIPMSIENDPKILTQNNDIELNENEIEQIKNFIRNNQIDILLFSKNKIGIIDFFNTLKEKGYYIENR
ncbi:hypothetical protein AGMMS50255_6780 [Spirochaetia bacterium]|nr:hypothetical protein AGMMS50255_6780 [Spirochaetia bacterium]